jgi:hypothetical protein
VAEEIAAAARARLDAAAPPDPSPSADPELQAARRQVAALLAAAAREADALLRRAWRAGPEEEAPGGRLRRWRR